MKRIIWICGVIGLIITAACGRLSDPQAPRDSVYPQGYQVDLS